jgi:O-antigen/teichoic acid export membrane protein
VSAPRDAGELDRSFVRNIFWTGAAKAVSQLLSWMSAFIVARLLTPEDYGLVGMATIFLGVVMLVSESGIGITIVTLRNLGREQVAQLNTVAVLLGLVGFLACLAGAIPLGWFFRSEALPPVVVALGTTFAISGFRVVPNALLQQDLRFRLIASFEAVNIVVQSATMVILAWAGLGYWTLVAGSVLGTTTSTLLTLSFRPERFRWPRWEALREALAFTKYQLGGTLLWYWYTMADQVVAGRVLGRAQLGVYSLSLTIASYSFSEKITTLITQVTPAYFAALQEDPAGLKRYLLRLTEIISVVTFPALFGLAVVSDDFVRVVLGPKWLEMINPLRLLAIHAAINATSPLLSRVLTVRGHIRYLMRISGVLAVVLPLAFIAGSRWGPTGIAAAWVIVFPLTRIPVVRLVGKSIGASGREYLRSFWPAVSASIVMVLAVLLLRALLPAQVPLPMRLLLEVLCGACVYVAVVLAFHRERVDVLLKLRDSWRRRDVAEPPAGAGAADACAVPPGSHPS